LPLVKFPEIQGDVCLAHDVVADVVNAMILKRGLVSFMLNLEHGGYFTFVEVPQLLGFICKVSFVECEPDPILQFCQSLSHSFGGDIQDSAIDGTC
jgi:hypothetical protein